MDIQTIAIIGAGTMGNGIAHTAARSGFKVILHDIAESFLDRAVSTIAKNLEREVAKGRITANDKNAVLSRISAVTQNSALSEADFVIEAVIEDIETKLRVFEGMDRIARPDVILASNTSSISITKLGLNHPMGPLALADLIGLDVCLDIIEVLHSGLGDSKYRPCPLLRKIVDAGHLGRKSGRGFYKY